ncbi:MAG: thioredoxin [Anaerolineales bacterium]|nr:thioredoxin [Anaerolineales bacterium]
MANLPELNDENFEVEVLQSELPVLVDFGAEWCHPCKQLDPIVEELASEWEGKVKVVKLDIDSNVDSTMRFGVMGVPTLILFIDGEPVERLMGFVPKKRILDKLEPHFAEA